MHLNLLLIRHAKSSWSNQGLDDFDRPLNDRGNHSAPLMGKRIKNYNLDLDTIISSPAKRAKATAKLIAQQIDFDLKNIEYHPDLYLASRDIFISILSVQEKESVAIVGHNPGIQDFSYWLCSEPTLNISTCGVIHISFNLDKWAEIHRNCGVIRSFEYPKMFT